MFRKDPQGKLEMKETLNAISHSQFKNQFEQLPESHGNKNLLM